MKLIWITLIVSLLTLTAVLGQDNEEYDYEEEAPVAPQPVQRGRTSLLSSRQSKALPLSGNNNNNKIKTVGSNWANIKRAGSKASAGAKQAAATKAPPAPAQEEQNEYEDEYDQPAEEPEVTSTEAPKKTIKPIVRPFRSNDDLLAALKRRRQQVQSIGAVVDKTTTTTSTTTSAPVGSHKKGSNSFSSGRRGRVSNPGHRGSQATQATETVAAEVEPTKKSPQSRRYNTRNSARAPQPVEEEKPVEEQTQQPQPKPKFGRGSRRPN